MAKWEASQETLDKYKAMPERAKHLINQGKPQLAIMVTDLEAENQRLREALEKIANEGCEESAWQMSTWAARALAPREDEHGP